MESNKQFFSRSCSDSEECCGSVVEFLSCRDQELMPEQRHHVVSLSETIYP